MDPIVIFEIPISQINSIILFPIAHMKDYHPL